jgi:hypothetical protein
MRPKKEYKEFCENLEKLFIEAVGAAVALDDLLIYTYRFVTRRMSPQLLDTAKKRCRWPT